MFRVDSRSTWDEALDAVERVLWAYHDHCRAHRFTISADTAATLVGLVRELRHERQGPT